MRISNELKIAIKQGMHAAYAEVRFKVPRRPARWPQCFATITGFATTGEKWSDAKNKKADAKLKAFLQNSALKPFVSRATPLKTLNTPRMAGASHSPLMTPATSDCSSSRTLFSIL